MRCIQWHQTITGDKSKLKPPTVCEGHRTIKLIPLISILPFIFSAYFNVILYHLHGGSPGLCLSPAIKSLYAIRQS